MTNNDVTVLSDSRTKLQPQLLQNNVLGNFTSELDNIYANIDNATPSSASPLPSGINQNVFAVHNSRGISSGRANYARSCVSDVHATLTCSDCD